MQIKNISFMVLGALLLTGAGCMSTTSTTPTNDSEIDLSDYELDLSGISVEVRDPQTVKAGEAFTFGVRVQNTQNTERSLRSIDIDRTFLTGLEITDVNYKRSDEYYVESLDQDIFEFNTPIKANGSLEVTFSAVAKNAGEYGGDFDICIDNDINCVFESIDVIVQ